MAYSKEKQQKLVTALTNVGSLAGVNDSGIANGVKGLGLSLEQTKCNQEATQVRDGLFKVAITGTFSCGKSTIINALIGGKILPEAVVPCTAILTFIQYGTDESKAEVHMADTIKEDGTVVPGECVVMDIEVFREKYKYTKADEEEVAETGMVKRFAAVKYAVMRCSKQLMEGGVTIIDSPGLEDKKIATDLALNIAEEAQAIIYCLPERGTNKDDRAYIESNFRNCPSNVFFLINKFDLVPANEREDLLNKVKTDLTKVFTDVNGNFNETLYAERVFPISARWALDAQIGTVYDNIFGRERTLTKEECKILLEGSLFGAFEKQLEKFLTTDEKCLAQYQKCFAQMSSTYRGAQQQIEGYVQAYEVDINLDQQKKAECEQLIEDIRKSIQVTETTFDNCSLKIQNSISEVLGGCSESIERTWEHDMAEIAKKIDVGTLSFMFNGLKQMNPLASKAQKEAQMEKFVGKFVTAVTEHFSDKVDEYLTENMPKIEKVAEECQQRLNVSIEKIDDLLGDLARKITNVNPSVNNPDKSWLQIMISAYLGDYSAMTKGAIDGKSNWTEYLKKTLFNTVWQVVLLSFIDGGLGVLLACAIEYLQGRANSKESVKKILANTKDGVVKGIREKLVESRKELNNNIAVKISNKKKVATTEMLQTLRDEENRMNEIIAAHNDHNFNLEEEKKRFALILNSIFEEAKDAYSVVNERSLSLNEFKAF